VRQIVLAAEFELVTCSHKSPPDPTSFAVVFFVPADT